MYKRIIFLPAFLFILLIWSWRMAYKHIQEDFLFYFLIFTTLYISVLVISVFKKLYNLRLLLFSFSLIIIFAELFLFLAGDKLYKMGIKSLPVKEFYFDILPTYSASSLSFDRSMGYRWSEENVQVRKMAMENVLFANQFIGNNFGMHSNRDYQKEKSDVQIKRWIVFGDSFTDAYYLKRGWVDVLDSLYKATHAENEFYSFSINGGGIKNWYQIYRNYISDNFEYDGVVFAVFGNDLARGFFVMDQDGDKLLTKYYDSVPDLYQVKSDLSNGLNIAQNVKIDSQLDSRWYISRLLNWVYRRYLEHLYLKSIKTSSSHLVKEYVENSSQEISENILTQKYGEGYIIILEMLSDIKAKGKSVIIISIPDEYGLSMNQRGVKTQIQNELEWISNKNNVYYIDGYQLLLKNSMKMGEKLFIPFDGHWKQSASDTFAFMLFNKHFDAFK